MNKKAFDIKLKTLLNIDKNSKGFNDERYEDENTFEKWKPSDDKFKKETSGTKPNMASYGSSSRFLYKTFYNQTINLGDIKIENIEFEKIMKHKIHANFDMYFKKDNNHYYFEGKCHEIFDYHYPKFPKSYHSIFDEYNIEYEEEDKCIRIKHDFSCGFNHISFDIKQFICHILSILETKNNNNYLIYLLYAPKYLMEENKELYNCFETQFVESINYVKDIVKDKIEFKLFYKISLENEEPNFIEKELKY